MAWQDKVVVFNKGESMNSNDVKIKNKSSVKIVAVGRIKNGKVTINCSKDFLKAQK